MIFILIHLDWVPRYARRQYRRRFGIETSYRCVGQVRGWTTSPKEVGVLSLFDWGNFIVPWWARIVVGLPTWLAGDLLATWALAALGIAPTSGSEGTPVQRGPYRFSRNPQYVGFMIGLVGWAVMTDSAFLVKVDEDRSALAYHCCRPGKVNLTTRVRATTKSWF